MQKLCKRHVSSLPAALPKDQKVHVGSKKGIRDLLSGLRAGRDNDKQTLQDRKLNAVGIRQLVQARSSDFKSEINKLTSDEYMAMPISRRVQARFKGESARSLLNNANESPQIQAEFLAKCLVPEHNEDFESEDNFDDYTDVGALEMDDYITQMEPSPGDLVEYWPDKGQRITCIILRKPGPASGKRYMTISDRGKIDYTNPNRYRFIIPGFCDGSKITQEGLLQQSDVELIPVRRALKSFKDQTEKISSRYSRELASIYQRLPERLQSQSRTVSVADVCKLLFNSSNQMQMYSVFAAMTIDRVHFLPDPVMHLSVPLFSTRPKDEVDVIKKVTVWTRSRSTSYKDFIKRAKEVAKFGTAVASKPSKTLTAVHCKTEFTKNDQIFLSFMVRACLERIDSTESEIYTIPISAIVKDLGLFPEVKADRRIVHATLKKLGVLAPWDANIRRLQAAELPGHGSSQKADQDEDYIASNFGTNQVEDLSRLGLRDRSDKLRHDFGNLCVYTIDGAGAAELDDGLSIEGDWLHVHIADPSSFIPHNSRLGEIARSRVETRYLEDGLFPMLPIKLAMRHFSLGGSVNATPAMTTSIRIDEKGDIQEVLIRPSVIRNVKKVTYEMVDREVFGASRDSFVVSSLSSNWNSEVEGVHSQPRSSRLKETDHTTLKSISHYLKRAHKYRFDHGMLDMFNVEKATQLQPHRLPLSRAEYSSPVFYAGRPGILTSVHSLADSPARSLVTEAAILANRATAQYCTENKIPIIYRTMRTRLTDDERAVLQDKRDSKGRIRMEELLPFLNKFESSKLALAAAPAEALGIPNGYTNATSPLRRYIDMVTQWQIQSFLLKEPYQLELLSILPHLIRKGPAIKRVAKASARHWVLQLLQQKADAGDALEFNATVLVNNPQVNLPTEAMLQGVGERCLIRRDPGDPVMPTGTDVKVKVEDLDLMDNVIYVRRIKE